MVGAVQGSVRYLAPVEQAGCSCASVQGGAVGLVGNCVQGIVTVSWRGGKKKPKQLFLTANQNLAAHHTFSSKVEISIVSAASCGRVCVGRQLAEPWRCCVGVCPRTPSALSMPISLYRQRSRPQMPRSAEGFAAASSFFN